MQFKIANLLVDISPNEEAAANSSFLPFQHEFHSKPDLSIELYPTPSLQKPEGDLILDDLNKWVMKKMSSHSCSVYQCSTRYPDDEVIIRTDVFDDWNTVRISYLPENDNVRQIVEHSIGQVVFKNRILFHEGMILHASAIKVNDKAILFSAPSGTGKSTHAGLWKKHYGAEILNDDCPAIRMIDGKIVAFGTPWCGSVGIFKNDYAEIAAIVLLEQAEKNQMRALSAKEAIPLVLPRCFLPYHDQQLMSRALEVVEYITNLTPIYSLRCKPDQEAVETVMKWIEL